jgi:WD40 repeat protein
MSIPTELVEQFARGNGVVFVGAGLSQGAGLPGWSDLIRELAAELDGCPPDADPREIAQYYDNEHGRNRLVQRLRDRLDTLRITPTPVHEALVGLPVSAFFTTNYDDLLEQALRAAKRSFTPVVGNADTSFWSADRLQLVKLHGDLGQPESIVITTGDYEQFALTRKSLADILKVTLQTRTVLFLGYSAADPDLRLILTQVRDESGRFARSLYAVQFGAPTLTAKDLERRGLKVIDLGVQPDGDARNTALREWLQALNDQVTAKSRELKPNVPQKPQTATEMLAGEIQTWLEAMGYMVSGQPYDDNCVDLNAAFRRGLEEQHVLVRCVAGEITAERLATLDQDVAARGIPRGWAVSDRLVPPSARVYADAHPVVRPFSLTDFVSQIFGSYFDRLRRLVEESDIPHYYIDLSCHRRVLDSAGNEVGQDQYEVIDTYVDDWLKARDANHLSILGEFGSGKTWFCRHYAYRQLDRYLKDPVHERLPILVTLRDYAKQIEVGSLIRKMLDEQGVRLGGLEAFEELNRRGKFLLIFDGFDEMAVKVDYQTVVDYFWELSKVVVPGSKALLTCRTGYFRYATEAEKVMRGEELGRQMIVIRPPKFEVAYLEPFTDRQICEALTRRCGPEAAQSVLGNPDLAGLARQPVLIEMLMEAMSAIKAGTAINKSEVYRLAVDRWLEQDIRAERTFMDKWDKVFFMMELAWEMVSTSNLKIHYRELPERINRYFGLEKPDEMDHYDYDIRAKSFLRRDVAGYYEFTHKSLAEYLVALKFGLELGVMRPEYQKGIPPDRLAQYTRVRVPAAWRSGAPGAFLDVDWERLRQTVGVAPLSLEVREFLKDMVLDVNVMWQIIRQTKGKSPAEIGYTGGNIATLLRLQGESFSVPRGLDSTVLTGADLRNTSLTGADLHGAYWHGANLSGCTLADADLRDTDLTDARFEEMGGIRSVAWAPDGDYLLSGGRDGVVRVWHTATWEGVESLPGPHEAVWAVCWGPQNPHGQTFASAGRGGPINIWGQRDLSVVAALPVDDEVYALAFAPDGDYLAAAVGSKIMTWDVSSRQVLCSPDFHTNKVYCLCYSHSGRYLASGGWDRQVAIWRVQEGKLTLDRSWQAHDHNVISVSFSADDRFLLTGSDDKRLKLWDLEQEVDNCRVLLEHDSFIRGRYSPDGRYIAAVSWSPDSRVWLMDAGTQQLKWSQSAHSRNIIALTFSPDCKRLATGSEDTTICIWDVESGGCLTVLEIKMNCRGARIGDAKGLDVPAPDGEGVLRDWLIARGAVE